MNFDAADVIESAHNREAEEAMERARKLGWSLPPRSVVEMARALVAARDIPSGELLVFLGYITSAQLERAMAKKGSICFRCQK